jgi:hypothetical protein
VSVDGPTVGSVPTESEPLVEGEPASAVLRAILTFRICSVDRGYAQLSGGGADPAATLALRRALTRVEDRLLTLPRSIFDAGHSSETERRREVAGEAFHIVATKAMTTYGMTVAPWQHQLGTRPERPAAVPRLAG